MILLQINLCDLGINSKEILPIDRPTRERVNRTTLKLSNLSGLKRMFSHFMGTDIRPDNGHSAECPLWRIDFKQAGGTSDWTEHSAECLVNVRPNIWTFGRMFIDSTGSELCLLRGTSRPKIHIHIIYNTKNTLQQIYTQKGWLKVLKTHFRKKLRKSLTEKGVRWNGSKLVYFLSTIHLFSHRTQICN